MQNRCLDRCPIPAGRFSKRGKMRIGLVLGQCPESPTERIHAKSECLRAGLANLLNLSPITIVEIRHADHSDLGSTTSQTEVLRQGFVNERSHHNGMTHRFLP